MIKEAYCSFEVAKLLKEKGFEGDISAYYHIWDNGSKVCSAQEFNHSEAPHLYIPAPTHQMAMKWLREVHNIFIVIEPYSNTSCYFSLWEGDNYYENPLRKGFPSYEETVEQALKYCLKKIIK